MNSSLLLELTEIQLALTNAMQDATILERLAVFGYSPERLSSGLQMREEALVAYDAQQKAVAEQLAATTVYNQAWEEADQLYAIHRLMARRLLAEDRDAVRQLKLTGARPTDYPSWSIQCQLFYKTNRLPKSYH